MAEEIRLESGLQDVLREMSKAPGGNVSQPRPVTPGPILGGPKPETPVRGVVDPATGVRTVRDPARELFRFYAYGEEKTSKLPAPKPDTKTVTTQPGNVPVREQKILKARLEADLPVKQTAERKAKNQGVRQGTIGGMSRAPGSKPPVVTPEALARQATIDAARRRAEIQVIRDALERFAVAGYYEGIGEQRYIKGVPQNSLTVEEKKYLDNLAKRINDIIMDREAAMKEQLAARGDMTSAFEDYKAQKKADHRTLESRKVAERNRVSRAKTEQSFKENIVKVPGGNTGKGTPMGDAKDIAMRKISNAAIVELQDTTRQSQITTAQPGMVGKTSSETSLLKLGPATGDLSGKTIMLARNGKLANKPLRPETINQITMAAKAGANFVVGDMPGVDSEFIKLLDKLDAPYRIYHTGNAPRIQTTKKIVKENIPRPIVPRTGGVGPIPIAGLNIGGGAIDWETK